MKRLAAVVVLLTPVLCWADDDPEPPRPAAVELKKLQGTWDVVKAIRNGRDDTKELQGRGAHLVIEKDRFSFAEGQDRKETMTIVLDPKKKPAQMEIRSPRDKVSVLAIYKFDKDVLTIAFNDPTQEPPKGFDKARHSLELKKRPAKK